MDDIPVSQEDIIRRDVIEHRVGNFNPKNPLSSREEEVEAIINPQGGTQQIKTITELPYFQCSRCRRLLSIKKIGIEKEEATAKSTIEVAQDGTKKITPIIKQLRFCRRCSFLLRLKGISSFILAPLKDIKNGED